MRALITIGFLVASAGVAFAQAPAPVGPAAPKGCWPVTTRDLVVVVMEEGAERRGTLLCMGPEEIVLTGSGTLPLNAIFRISKPRDGVLDGVLKGAAVGLVIAALCAGECDPEYLLRGTLGYAAMGGIIDAVQGNEKTIYLRPPAPMVGWRVRF